MRSHRALPGLGIVALVSHLFAAPAIAQHAATPITGHVHIGPYRIGMTADEIQSATPTVKWEVERTESGAVRMLSSANGLLLAGQLFNVVATIDDGYGKYLLSFYSHTNVDMKSCEKNFLAVVTEMEKQFGIFSPSSSFVIPVGKSVMAAGRMSTVQFDKDRRNAIWNTVRLIPAKYDGYDALLHAHLNNVKPELDGCFISADIIYEPELAH